MSVGPPPRLPARDTDTPSGRSLPAALSSLEHPQFRWLFGSNVAFFLAMNSQGLVRGWLAYQLTQSEFALGLVFFAVAVPMFVVAPLGGVLSDRYDRRNLIAIGQSFVIASELVLLALISTDRIEFWHLLVAAFLMGCVFPFIMPARQALVVNVVGKHGLTNAMAIGMAGMNSTRVLGPALAGFLLEPLDIAPTYGVGVALYVLALLALLRVHRYPAGALARDASIWSKVGEGARYVRDHRLVLILILFGLIPMFLAMPFQNLLPVFAEDVWDVGGSGLGLLSAAGGLGGVAGAFYVAWRIDDHRRVARMMLSISGFGVFLFAFSLTSHFFTALALIFVANAFASVYSTLNNTAIQMIIPDAVRGRVSSFLMMSFSLPMLGALPMGALAEGYGAPFAVALASALAVIVAIGFYAWSPTLRKMDRGVREALDAEDSAAGAGATG